MSSEIKCILPDITLEQITSEYLRIPGCPYSIPLTDPATRLIVKQLLLLRTDVQVFLQKHNAFKKTTGTVQVHIEHLEALALTLGKTLILPPALI